MVIDVHTHIFPPEIIASRHKLLKIDPSFAILYTNKLSPIIDSNNLLNAMDRDGVDISWVLGFPWKNLEYAKLHNNYLAQVVKNSKGRLRGLACVAINQSWALNEAKRALNLGLHGLGELALYNNDIDIKMLTPLCQLCSETNTPLLLHTNEPIGHHYPGKSPINISTLYKLIKKNPKTKLILSHMGAGLFFYSILKLEVSLALTNVWIDTAASIFLYHPRIYSLAIEFMGANKLLLGSDYPLLPITRYQTELTSPEAKLTSKSLTLIMGKTARSLIP